MYVPLRGAAAVPRAVALVTAARVARVGYLADQLVALCSSVDMRLDILDTGTSLHHSVTMAQYKHGSR